MIPFFSFLILLGANFGFFIVYTVITRKASSFAAFSSMIFMTLSSLIFSLFYLYFFVGMTDVRTPQISYITFVCVLFLALHLFNRDFKELYSGFSRGSILVFMGLLEVLFLSWWWLLLS